MNKKKGGFLEFGTWNLEFLLAEDEGLEPPSPCGHRFSRPAHYQLC